MKPENTQSLVLIVDDDPINLNVLVDFLNSNNLNVSVAQNGQEAIKLAEKVMPEIILLDIVMPGMDGFEVCRRLKENNATTGIPVIFMTALTKTEDKINGFKAGGVDYITKPLQPQEVLARVQTHLNLQALQNRLEYLVEERTAALAKANEQLQRKIEEHKRAEDRYRLSLEASPDSIVVYDIEGRAVYVNTAFEQTFGWPRNEIIGNRIDFVPQENQAETQAALKRMLKGEKIRSFESKRRTKDGRLLDVHISASIFDGQEGKPSGNIVILRDITQTKYLQEQLIQSERLAATGQLAASVAHEINSPLQGITSFVYSIQQSHQQDKVLMNDLQLIKTNFARIRDIVKNLLDFNRPGMAHKQSVNINQTIITTVSLLRSHLKKQKIKINLNLSSKIPNILAVPQHLGQVFLNLINNAAESIIENSRPASERINRVSYDGEITLTSHYEKDKIIIKVSDTGPGISENDLAFIFDSFYTQKKTMGMGIGLSICHNIIKNHNGMITAENSPQGGAVFAITLPAGINKKNNQSVP